MPLEEHMLSYSETNSASMSHAPAPYPMDEENAGREDVTLDDVMAKEMKSLSVQERENVYYDLHGVHSTTEEPETLLEAKLGELDLELSAIRDKNAYDFAAAQAPFYTTDRDFRLMFLRSDNWNSKNAAMRMTRHFRTKLELFGQEKLTKTITQDDLSADDMTVLYSGYCQHLPFRDTTGRAVFVICPRRSSGCLATCKARIMWYIIMSAVGDVETQRSGIVLVLYLFERGEQTVKSPIMERGAAWKVGQLSFACPIKCVAVHQCTASSDYKVEMAFILNSINAFSRLRCRYHVGTHIEVIYELMTFGISGRTLPFNQRGNCFTEAHVQRLEKRKRLEESRDLNVISVDTPKNEDVVFGRGRPIQDHIGNVRFRDLIDSSRPKYDSSDRKGKTTLAAGIVQSIHVIGGRFLRDDEVGWVVVDEVEARKKVSMAFRSHRKLQKLSTPGRKRILVKSMRNEDEEDGSLFHGPQGGKHKRLE